MLSHIKLLNNILFSLSFLLHPFFIYQIKYKVGKDLGAVCFKFTKYNFGNNFARNRSFLEMTDKTLFMDSN